MTYELGPWHNLTPRQQLHVMLDAEMDRLDAVFGPVRPFTESPEATSRNLTQAANLLLDVQACAIHDRIRHTPRTAPGASQ